MKREDANGYHYEYTVNGIYGYLMDSLNVNMKQARIIYKKMKADNMAGTRSEEQPHLWINIPECWGDYIVDALEGTPK